MRSLLILLCVNSFLPAAEPVDIGTRVEMFVDEHLIDRKQNVELHLTQPTRREIVLELNKPWEGPTSAYYTVFRDGEKIRLYYRGGTEDYTCYAESTDGVHFTRPELGIVEFEGSTRNNIIYKGPESASFAPFLDQNPQAKKEEKYKALSYRVMNRTGRMMAMASPDGIHWHRMSEEPVVPPGQYDSLNVVTWDAIDKKYRVFDRVWSEGGFKGVRGIESRTSDDFLHWSDGVPNRYADGVPREHFYTSSTIRCPGAEHQWLAFPMRFVPDRTKVPSHPEKGISDNVFMTSRDGVTWDRTFLQSWSPAGPDERNWTERSNMPAWGIFTTDGEPNEFTMYLSEHYRWPTNRLRRVSVRKFGFASIRANGQGEFVTKAIRCAGDQLMLNYSTAATGSLKVELLDESGSSIQESELVFGDELSAQVKWKGGDLARFVGKPVRLRFVMNNADVYAMRFGATR
jgi:hypothetical protein